MYKVLLADDEGIVIDSVTYLINKEFPGECEIRSARTGRSVIELAEEFRPDIAVMDIQMPGINGLDAMREIRGSNRSVYFIVMSAYDKFDYAQEAIKLGAIDYITKPMERTRMVAVLKEAMRLVSSDREKRSNDLKVREKLETVMPILEGGLIYSVLMREHFSGDIDNYRSLLGLEGEYAYMMTIICGDALEAGHMTNAIGGGVRMQKQYTQVREFVKQMFNCVVGNVMANKIPVLVTCSEPVLGYEERNVLIERARDLVHNLRRRLDYNFRIGIGRVKSFSELADSYNEAIEALELTKGSVAHADDLPLGCEYAGDYPISLEKALFDAVGRGRTDEAEETVRRFNDWMKNSDLMSIRVKCLEFAIRAETLAYEKGGMIYSFDSRREYLPEIMSLESAEELKEWLAGKIVSACRDVRDRQAQSSVSAVETAKEYIKKNYDRNISLEDVSREVNISAYYFSRIFKEETGVNFIDYLTDLRIERAKELLSQGVLSMKEICLQVGYSDPNYFSRSFKKKVGVTPTEFREGK